MAEEEQTDFTKLPIDERLQHKVTVQYPFSDLNG